MLIIYNIVQLLGLIVFAPFLFVKVILTPKYRGRIRRRLAIGLEDECEGLGPAGPRIWIHALSLGEVSSARALVMGVRQALPQAVILFSSSTRAGEEFARKTLQDHVDRFVPFPLDIRWSVERAIRLLQPDLFILVETDFWPNFLMGLKRRGIAALLVNGRVSRASFARYKRFAWIFAPLFASFRFISMQTKADAEKMIALGVQPASVAALGNLKYESATAPLTTKAGIEREPLGIGRKRIVWVAGSTHRGEEEIVFRVYRRLAAKYPDLFLVVAPRNVERGAEVMELARKSGIAQTVRRSSLNSYAHADVLVVDTLGELVSFYGLGDLAFVGGSLVQEGGHNPLEPAGLGRPVLFGPHMDDFEEICIDLVAAGGAITVHDEEELFVEADRLLADPVERQAMGGRAAALFSRHQGVTARHMAVIERILTQERGQ